MSKKKLDTANIRNELEDASVFFSQKASGPKAPRFSKKHAERKKQDTKPHTDATTSTSDAVTSPTDVTYRRQHINRGKLATVIQSVAEIPVGAQNTPVRLSVQEKRDIEEFIYGRLRKSGLTGAGVSTSKLLRYALRYLMKVHEEEFVQALKEALTRKAQLPI